MTSLLNAICISLQLLRCLCAPRGGVCTGGGGGKSLAEEGAGGGRRTVITLRPVYFHKICFVPRKHEVVLIN